MSVIRRSAQSEVYMYEFERDDGGGMFHCQICPLRESGDVFCRTRIGAALHLFMHWLVGNRIPLMAALSGLRR